MTDYGLKVEDLEPLHDRVIVRMIKLDETAGGIIIPDIVHANAAIGEKGSDRNAKQGSAMRAEVLKAGPGRFEDGVLGPMSVAMGDVILMPPPRCLTDMGDGLFMVRDGDIAIKCNDKGKN